MKRQPASDLRGNLARFPLDLVLQFLGTARASGRLSVQHASETVSVDLVAGRIAGGGRDGGVGTRDAASARQRLEAAMSTALGWRTGTFVFAPASTPAAGAGILDLGVDEVLLACVSRVDQARRKQAERV
jgi:hypothetical protein